MSLELPLRVAVMLAIFLVVLTITGFVAFFLSDRAHFRERTQFSYILILLGLLVAIPVVVYHAMRLWLEGDLARFPDIDEAWREGMIALQQNGLDLAQMPLFLIIGAPDQRQADNLMRASGMSLILDAVPTGRAPLRWYASETAVFLFTIGTGCLSRLSQGATLAGGHRPTADLRGMLPQPNISGTMVAGNASVRDPAPHLLQAEDAFGGGGPIGGTLVPGSQATAIPGQASAAPPTLGSSLTRQERDLGVRPHSIPRPATPSGTAAALPAERDAYVATAANRPRYTVRQGYAGRYPARHGCLAGSHAAVLFGYGFGDRHGKRTRFR